MPFPLRLAYGETPSPAVRPRGSRSELLSLHIGTAPGFTTCPLDSSSPTLIPAPTQQTPHAFYMLCSGRWATEINTDKCPCPLDTNTVNKNTESDRWQQVPRRAIVEQDGDGECGRGSGSDKSR